MEKLEQDFLEGCYTPFNAASSPGSNMKPPSPKRQRTGKYYWVYMYVCVHTVYTGDHVIDFVSAAKSCNKSKISKKENVPKTRKKPKQPGMYGTCIIVNWEIFMCSKFNVLKFTRTYFLTNMCHYRSSMGT